MDDPNTPASPQPPAPDGQAAQSPMPTAEADATPTTLQPTPAVPADDATLRELALLLLDPGRFADGANGRPPQLLVGLVAPDFPFAPPVPEGARIVGSYLHGQTMTVALDVPLDPVATWEFYNDRLGALGWRLPFDPGPLRHGGFAHSSADNRMYVYLSQDSDPGDGPKLSVTAFETNDGHSAVQLTLEPTPPGWRANGPLRRRQQMRSDGMWSVLPVIQAPPHARQSNAGGSGGDAQVTTHADLETDLDFAALTAHYQAQLEHGGWRRTDDGASDPVAWSSWAFTDDTGEPWSALFVLLRRTGLANRYYLILRAEWEGASRPAQRGQAGVASTETAHTGWTVYGPMSSSSSSFSPPTEPPANPQ